MGPDTVAATIEPLADIVCAQCEHQLDLEDEIVLVEIVQLHLVGGVVMPFNVINEHEVEGGYLFEPWFFCFDCWEEHRSDLRKETKDQPPVPDAESMMECHCCGSGIREWEFVGSATMGELRLSSRAPSNKASVRFAPLAKPDLLCLPCIGIINENWILMWEDLSQHGECADCTFARCWRYEGCACACHNEEIANDE